MCKTIHPVDKHVGKRIRSLREIKKLSQVNLAKEIGVTFQQVQKYETGTNRVSVSKLSDIAKTFEVHPSFFFEGLDEPDGMLCLTDDDLNILILFKKLNPSCQKALLSFTNTLIKTKKRRLVCQ